MFNSAQRAHQNTLEALPIVNLMMLCSGLVYPRLAALLGATWVLGRFLYIEGYSSKGPSGRHLGSVVSHLGDLPLVVTTFMAAWELVMK